MLTQFNKVNESNKIFSVFIILYWLNNSVRENINHL